MATTAHRAESNCGTTAALVRLAHELTAEQFPFDLADDLAATLAVAVGLDRGTVETVLTDHVCATLTGGEQPTSVVTIVDTLVHQTSTSLTVLRALTDVFCDHNVAGYDNISYLATIAYHDCCDAALLARCIEGDSDRGAQGLWSIVAAHRNLTAGDAHRIARVATGQRTLRTLAQREDLEDRTALLLAGDDDRLIRGDLVFAKATVSPALAAVLVGDPAPEIRAALARRDDIDVEHIAPLRHDPRPEVAAAAWATLERRGHISIDSDRTPG